VNEGKDAIGSSGVGKTGLSEMDNEHCPQYGVKKRCQEWSRVTQCRGKGECCPSQVNPSQRLSGVYKSLETVISAMCKRGA